MTRPDLSATRLLAVVSRINLGPVLPVLRAEARRDLARTLGRTQGVEFAENHEVLRIAL